MVRCRFYKKISKFIIPIQYANKDSSSYSSIYNRMSFAANDIETIALFSLIDKGNEMAFKQLFEQYKTRAYAVAYKFTKCTVAAEEITQEVFISIWVSKDQLRLVKKPSAYIYTIIYNQVKQYLKKESNQNRILQLYAVNSCKLSNETEETIQANECQRLVNKALDTLSPQKKRIFNLSRQHGQSYREIGAALHLSPHTVKSHLLQTIKFIKTFVENASSFLLSGIIFLFF